jgi:multidrug efflux system outer membrane protein
MTHSARFPDVTDRTYPIARVIACSLILLVLPACGIPPRRLAQPAPALPESFNGVTSATNSSKLGIAEFYRDPKLLSLIQQTLANNRELKILNEEVQIASNEILARSGAYLPFLTLGPSVGLDRPSNRTIEGAAIRDDEFLPGRFFSNPHANYLLGTNFTWQLDIYRQLRNARDAAARRYVAAIERRNYFETRLVADIAENYFRLMALDKRFENLNQIIVFLENSLKVAQARKEFARDTELAVLRFEAEVRRNQSEKLIVNQDMIETENRINFLAYRFPQPVERNSAGFFDLNINTLEFGVPSELLLNRPDIRRAERELAAAGLDVQVARANFYPQLILNAGVGLQAFNITYLFEPQAVIGNLAASFIGPLVNRRAVRAQYLTSNARQIQAIYDFQRTVLEAFTQVVNRLNEVQNYSRSVAIKKQQLASLESAVNVANELFQFARTEYLDVLTAQRDLRDARMALIDTKERQLIAIVNAYQALGGGTLLSISNRDDLLHPIPRTHEPLSDKDFCSLSRHHYAAGRYFKALRASLHGILPYRDRLNPPNPLNIPRVDQSAPAQTREAPAPTQRRPETKPADDSELPPETKPADDSELPPETKPADDSELPPALPAEPDVEATGTPKPGADDSGLPPALPPVPPPATEPGPFGRTGTADPGADATGGTK